MKLPQNLRLLPGVRTDHKGKQYQYGIYPSGKRIAVPYSASEAQLAQMIPLPPEPRPVRKERTPTTGVDAKRLVIHRPQRLHCVEERPFGTPDRFKFQYTTQAEFARHLESLRPLMRSPDCGKTWLWLETPLVDWHVCYHRDAEADKKELVIREKEL